MIAVLDGAGHRDDLDPEERGVAEIVGIEGFGDEHPVARIGGRGEGEEDGLGAGGGDEELGIGELEAGASVVTAPRRTTRGETLGGSIGEDLLPEVAERRPHRFRRGQVRLADIEVMDGHAAAACRVGKRHQPADGGGWGESGPVGKLRHSSCSFSSGPGTGAVPSS